MAPAVTEDLVRAGAIVIFAPAARQSADAKAEADVTELLGGVTL